MSEQANAFARLKKIGKILLRKSSFYLISITFFVRGIRECYAVGVFNGQCCKFKDPNAALSDVLQGDILGGTNKGERTYEESESDDSYARTTARTLRPKQNALPVGKLRSLATFDRPITRINSYSLGEILSLKDVCVE